MKLSGRVFAGTDVDRTAARFATGVNGALNSGAGVVGLAAGGAVVFNIENRLRG